MLMANATTTANIARLIRAMRYRNTRKMEKPKKPHSDITRSHPPSSAGPQFPGPTPTNQARGEFVQVLIAIIQRATRRNELRAGVSSEVKIAAHPLKHSSGTLAIVYWSLNCSILAIEKRFSERSVNGLGTRKMANKSKPPTNAAFLKK